MMNDKWGDSGAREQKITESGKTVENGDLCALEWPIEGSAEVFQFIELGRLGAGENGDGKWGVT